LKRWAAGLRRVSADAWFRGVFGGLVALAVAPFWATTLLPMQDYPQFLLFARALGELGTPGSPFFGTYVAGPPYSPLSLPLLIVRALGALSSLETAGRLLWTAYAIALPLASLDLLRALGRSRWAVLPVFVLVPSYWVLGGFFGFATAMPLVVLGLASTVRCLERADWRRTCSLALVAIALVTWHALAYAQLVVLAFALAVMHLDRRAILRVLAALIPSLALWTAWFATTVLGRVPGTRGPHWEGLPPAEELVAFFEPIAAPVPGASWLTAAVFALALASTARGPRERRTWAWLVGLATLGYFALPMVCFGVEGIANRQPYLAALLAVFAWSPPLAPRARAATLAAIGAAGATVLVLVLVRVRAFDGESVGASRLIDLLSPGDTLFAPVGTGSTRAFPQKPLVAVDLYASIRGGGLPNRSFAGYDINVVRYRDGHNPMPDLRGDWLTNPALTRFDYVLWRGPTGGPRLRPDRLRLTASDGDWSLYLVCGSRAHPTCPPP
jgi:hypothetical protein